MPICLNVENCHDEECHSAVSHVRLVVNPDRFRAPRLDLVHHSPALRPGYR